MSKETVLSKFGYIEGEEWDSVLFDEECETFIGENSINKYKHYLLFMQGCRWNGASGYKIVNGAQNLLNELLGYDTQVYCAYLGSRHRKKVHVFQMFIHDVPQGFKAYGIGLTEAEYTKLSNAKSFEDIEEFFSKYK